MSVSTVNVVPDSTKQNGAPPSVLAKPPPVGDEPDFHKAWLLAHHRPDGSFLQQYNAVHPNGVTEKTFQWGIGPLVIKASLDIEIQDIKANLGIQIPILGYHTIVAFNGNLQRGVTVKVDEHFASGQLTFTVSGPPGKRELTVHLDIKSVVGKWDTQHSILTY
ncbi:hypothetical protein JAAARDRAFT_43150 [Jaapia argillacea MUCL 33604]|uniref:Uncharacterized protein n=1 Tax=Jaapia argillacea MUCL 33604 TaxID=933084 RepID=A0A067PDA6_9AGAM|nr:hypothetical protein JAAARDRAFT_43150 [Jaapia argillacea MUCL 33604]